jgi:8-oxo-dGTP pyrophosphatase MutT (NUDIX family)
VSDATDVAKEDPGIVSRKCTCYMDFDARRSFSNRSHLSAVHNVDTGRFPLKCGSQPRRILTLITKPIEVVRRERGGARASHDHRLWHQPAAPTGQKHRVRVSRMKNQGLIDIVDEHDVVVRTATRAEMRAKRLRHRGVFVAVITTDEKLVIHQRSPHKDVWPSRWDIGAGGVVDSGETYEIAAHRELTEELGIAGELTDLGGGYYEDADVVLFARGFLCIHDGPYEFVDGEVVAIELVTLGEFEELLPHRLWCPDSIEFVLPLIGAHLQIAAKSAEG